jgi:DNA-binding Xre family transcriptional regulator
VPEHLPSDPLQRALILWLRARPNLTELARKLLRHRGKEPADKYERQVAVGIARTHLSRMRSGRNPDVPLSTVTELAHVAETDPLEILNFERDADLDAVADDARKVAKKKRGK